MEELFINALNMSITASYLALAVFVVRLFLKKAPKAFIVFLWATVGLRLIFPFSIESILSLIPSSQTVPTQILLSDTPSIQSGIPAVNSVINPIIEQTLTPNPSYSANPIQIISFIACIIWLTGVAVMLLYTIISYFRIYFKVKEAIPLKDNIFICDAVSSPFILGILRPKIFLPSDMNEEDRKYVIAHEKAHLKRLDHLWKPLGFLLLSVYWFNPVLWIAYILLCKDIELACDEKVIKEMGEDIKKQYSATLINCSVSQKMLTACPLAFGETGIKSRIKAVLNYKKPAFWVIVIAVLSCVAVSVCFLTNPPEKNNDDTAVISQSEVIRTGSTHPDVALNIKNAEISIDKVNIEFEWVNDTDEIIGYGHAFTLEYFNGEEWEEMPSAENNYVWPSIMLLVYPQGQEAVSDHAEYSIHVTDYYKHDRYGKYRISTDFCYADHSDEWFTATIEFTIVENSFDITASRVNYAEKFFPCLNSDKLYLNFALHLPITKFETLDDLQQFKNNYGESFSLDGFLDAPSFVNSTEYMNEEYFEKYTVFLVYASSGASNERFKVNSIYNDEQNFVVHLESYNEGESGDSIMSGWFITVSVEKDKVRNCTFFDADLNAVESTEEPTTSIPEHVDTTKTSFAAKTDVAKSIEMPDSLPNESLWIKIAAIENSDIACFAIYEKRDKIFLRWDEQFFELNWDIVDQPGMQIEMYLSDFDNDGTDEILAIPIQSYGTNCKEDEIHILEKSSDKINEYILSAKEIINFMSDNLQTEDNKITFFDSSIIVNKEDDEEITNLITVLDADVDNNITLRACIDIYPGIKTVASLTSKVTYQNGTFELHSFELNKWNG